MPATPSVENVQALLAHQFAAGVVTAAISDAALILEELPCMGQYSDARLEAITRYLAAHLLASTQTGAAIASKSIDGVAYSWRSATLGAGLEGTPLGQQALLLDFGGCLRDLERREVRVFSV